MRRMRPFTHVPTKLRVLSERPSWMDLLILGSGGQAFQYRPEMEPQGKLQKKVSEEQTLNQCEDYLIHPYRREGPS